MNPTLKRLLVAAALAASPAEPALAEGAGSSGAQFLRLGVGARAAALGDGYAALASGADSVYWNPAGLAGAAGPEATFSRARLFGLLTHDHAAAAFPFRGFGVGAAYTRLGQPPLKGYDNQGRRTSDFTAADQAVSISAAVPLGPSIGAGAAAKFAQSRVSSYSASTLLFDAGLQAQARGVALGLSVRNLGPGMRFYRERGKAPLTVEVSGAAPVLGAFMLAGSAGYDAPERSLRAAIGGELALSAAGVRSAFRGGFIAAQGGASPLTAFRGGLGVDFGRVSADYAFVPAAELGASHRFTIGVRFR